MTPRPRRLLDAGLLAGCLALLGACGKPEVGGAGTRWSRADGEPVLGLSVAGSDHEMGWRHGHVLREEIRDLVPRWLRAAFTSADPDAGTRQDLEGFCRIYAAQMKPLLPESVRAELKGLAEGCGLPEDDLLLLEVLRDGLRWHGRAARLLEGAVGSPPLAVEEGARAGADVGVAIEGPDAEVLRGRWLILERRPASGAAAPTRVVTWPGGLGAVAGSSERGVIAAAVEVRLPLERESLKGSPFGIGFRVALERAADAKDLLARLPRTSGHRVLAAGPGPGRVLALVAMAGDDPVESDGMAWVLAAAGADATDPRAASLDARLGAFSVRPGADELGPLLDAGRSAGASGPVVVLDASRLLWRDAPDAKAWTYAMPIR